MRILTFTTLFPNANQPRHGVFVKQRLKHLLGSGEIESRVVAPVPYYPRWMPDLGHYSRYKDVPPVEESDGLHVLHPKYLVIPKIGMTVAPHLLAWAALRAMRDIYRHEFKFDLIDAHYFYPDGIAAAIIARNLGVPFVVTARGSDINLIPKYRLARRRILSTVAAAAATITVSEALRDRLIELGADGGKVRTLRNGVDPAVFYPVERETARQRLGISRKTFVSVGNLIELKGHHLTIRALKMLDDANLIIIGAGPEEEKLRNLADAIGVAGRCRFEGEVDQEELKFYYSACDASILASSREGMANVLLESIACGCPVVATDTCGTPEVIRSAEAGVLIAERSAQGIADGVKQLFSNYPSCEDTVRYSTNFNWDATTDGQLDLFRTIVGRT